MTLFGKFAKSDLTYSHPGVGWGHDISDHLRQDGGPPASPVWLRCLESGPRDEAHLTQRKFLEVRASNRNNRSGAFVVRQYNRRTTTDRRRHIAILVIEGTPESSPPYAASVTVAQQIPNLLDGVQFLGGVLGPTTKALTGGDVYGLVAAPAVCQFHSDEHEILRGGCPPASVCDLGDYASTRSPPWGYRSTVGLLFCNQRIRVQFPMAPLARSGGSNPPPALRGLV